MVISFASALGKFVIPNEQTEKALDEITRWVRELAAGGNPDGGENIGFAIARQGSHMVTNAFLTEGDCTPFVPSGKRGTLHNQPRHRLHTSLRGRAASRKCRSLWRRI